MSSLSELLEKLISFPSITPYDAGCQDYIIKFLENIGFSCQPFNNPPVSNFFACYGEQKPLLVFAGHTDVVPEGDSEQWLSDPFKLTQIDGELFGRGVADMKGSLAAMMIAVKKFIQQYPKFPGSLGFLITSGEEGDDFLLGTAYVMEKILAQNITINYRIVGEPSSQKFSGDTLKIGRRGSLTGKACVNGVQGHVAYPHLAKNSIHAVLPALQELTTKCWDEGNSFFPPTTFQITQIQAGGEANNIIPGKIDFNFNFRFSTEQTVDRLKESVYSCFDKFKIKPQIEWFINGQPFLTSRGRLLNACVKVISQDNQKAPILSTTGGTSDGRFIAPHGIEVIELGPCNASIHQVNEHLSLCDLENLSMLYFKICKEIFNS